MQYYVQQSVQYVQEQFCPMESNLFPSSPTPYLMVNQQQHPVFMPIIGTIPSPQPQLIPPPYFNDHVYSPADEQMYTEKVQQEQLQQPFYQQHQTQQVPNIFPMENMAYNVYFDRNLSTWIYCPYIPVHYPMYSPSIQTELLPTVIINDNCEGIYSPSSMELPHTEQPILHVLDMEQQQQPVATAATVDVNFNNGDEAPSITPLFVIEPKEQEECANEFYPMETIFEEDNQLYSHMIQLKHLDYSTGTIECNCTFASNDTDGTDSRSYHCECMHDSLTG